MEQIRGKKLEITWGLLGSRPVVLMTVDDVQYIQLVIKRNPWAYSMVPQLEESFGTKAVTGMAFDYRASSEEGQLVTFNDPSVTGVYVRVEDFPKVEILFNK